MASILTVALAATLPLLSRAQQMGTAIPEVHPKMETAVCTQADGCTTRQTALVTDALARPFHLESDESVSCSTINLNASLCSDAQACARQCVLEGVQYGSIGVLTKGTAVTLRQYLPNGEGFTRVSPRVYLLAEDEMNYEILKLLNKEITFDVDLSRLSCGMNGALYLSEMDASGNRNTDYNPAGAAYGTGYCDAQCFNVSWINGLVCCVLLRHVPLYEVLTSSPPAKPRQLGQLLQRDGHLGGKPRSHSLHAAHVFEARLVPLHGRRMRTRTSWSLRQARLRR